MEYIEKVLRGIYVWNSSKLNRVEYFSYSILGSMLTLALLALINPTLDLEGIFWVYMSLFMLLAALVHNIYIAIVLVSKRLRDMGYDQVHLWWIFGLWLVTSIHSWGEPESTVTYSLLGLDVIVSLWLLFTPGKSK